MHQDKIVDKEVEIAFLSQSAETTKSGMTSLRSFRLLAGAFALTVSLLILLYILTWTLIPRSSSPISSTAVCKTESCVSAAAMLLRNIDMSADPCHDFFSFACGGVLRRPFSPETISKGVSTDRDEINDVLNKQFEMLYTKDMVTSDDVAMNSLYQVVRGIFFSCVQWHDPTVEWLPRGSDSSVKGKKPFDLTVLKEGIVRQVDDKSSSLEEFLATLVKTKTSTLFNIEISNVNASLSKFWMDGNKFAFLHPWNATTVDEIKNFSSDVGLHLTANIQKMIEIQNKFFMNVTTYNKYTSIENLQIETNKSMPTGFSFSWMKFLDKLYITQLNPDIQFEIGHFEQLIKIVASLAPEFAARMGPVYDFIRVDAAMSLRNFIPMERYRVLDASYSWSKFLISPSEGESTYDKFSRFCVEMATNAMQPISLDMFKRAYMTDNFTSIHSVFADVVNAMKQNVNEESWISSKSKEAIIRKIDSVKPDIGHFEIPVSELKSIFAHSKQLFNKAANFFDIALLYQDAKFRLNTWIQLSPMVPSYVDFTDQLTTGASYLPRQNRIKLTTGIISTFLHSKDSDHLSYGGVGFVIGHEIAHGFDPMRLGLDENDIQVVGSILDNDTQAIYEKNKECLVKSYGKKIMISNRTEDDGRRTVNDNFSDIVGLNAAFRAYRNKVAGSQKPVMQLLGFSHLKISPEKLFFIQAAHIFCAKKRKNKVLRRRLGVHSPPRARVNGEMQHSKEFSNVFGCKLGDQMFLSDADKCHNW